MENELVRHSRAGDMFHYRWAARRCLKMIRPHSSLKKVFIESSMDNGKPGEYVIDVAEYSSSSENAPENITYFQLKHSTKRNKIPFRLSDLENTLKGFAKRFLSHLKDSNTCEHPPLIKFSIVTNRLISKNIKDGVNAIRAENTTTKSFQRTLKKYTNLSGINLSLNNS